jgi:4-hydroxy-3-methylbut-2-enyl diphosphate reductase
MIDRAEDLDPGWVSGRETVGVTAGASAPEVLVKAVLARLSELGATSVSDLPGVPEDVTFPIPKALTTA